jgi:hypothetical protein
MISIDQPRQYFKPSSASFRPLARSREKVVAQESQ